ncbi:hypothetical protein SAMN05661010_02505 [Modicisalibacter muralis]|uniref:Phage Tail Collar Domain n=1 Tax=Modicisalibacter muralis TaxID=119000 RepID=A0A1G9MSY8_9GAMM|nr:phage tail protein [Halomonas muralis]SDL77329.1 hypothetical protein SAMN05661010_02505 [Halomonas muralis]
MAHVPTVPNFSQYDFELGDTDEAITKDGGRNAALVQFGGELRQTMTTLNQDLDQVAEDRQAAATSAGEALLYRDQAQEITETGLPPKAGNAGAVLRVADDEQSYILDKLLRMVMPAGAVMGFPFKRAPQGWYVANGVEKSRSADFELFAALAILTSGDTVAGSATISGIPTTEDIDEDSPLSGPGIPLGAVVESIVDANSVTISIAATATAVGVDLVFAPFGVGDGVTTFNLPNYLDMTPRWLGEGRGIAEYQADQNKRHDHDGAVGGGGGHDHPASSATAGRHGHGASAGQAGNHRHLEGGHHEVGHGSTAASYDGGPRNEGEDAGAYRYYTEYAGVHGHPISVAAGGEHDHPIEVAPVGDHDHPLTIQDEGGDEVRVRNMPLLPCIRC